MNSKQIDILIDILNSLKRHAVVQEVSLHDFHIINKALDKAFNVKKKLKKG